MIKPMLCHDLEVDGSVLKENGLDGDKVTAAYRKAVVEGLHNLMMRGFVAERKWDGTRVLAILDDGTVILQNRKGVIYTIRLPEIVAALKNIPGRWKIDGEVVWINPKTGQEEFTPCQSFKRQKEMCNSFSRPYVPREVPDKTRGF